MRRKESKAIRADKAAAIRAKAATAASAIWEPPPTTWPTKRPAYCFTVLCPDPALREPPWRVQLIRMRQWYGRMMGGDTDGKDSEAGYEIKRL